MATVSSPLIRGCIRKPVRRAPADLPECVVLVVQWRKRGWRRLPVLSFNSRRELSRVSGG